MIINYIINEALLLSNMLCTVLPLVLHDHGMDSPYKYYHVVTMLCVESSSGYVICFVYSNQDDLITLFLSASTVALPLHGNGSGMLQYKPLGDEQVTLILYRV